MTDADRERAVRELTRHCGDGRLTLDELEERITEVHAASTEAELALAFRELPSFRLGTSDSRQRDRVTAPPAPVPADAAPRRTRSAPAGRCGMGGLQRPPLDRILTLVRRHDVLVAHA